MTTTRWVKDTTNEWGTSLQGYLEISYERIVKHLGPPHSNGDGEKVDAEWRIRLASGQLATIYNYKDGKNYNGDSGLPVEKITDWHIGGHVKAVAAEVWAIFEDEQVPA